MGLEEVCEGVKPKAASSNNFSIALENPVDIPGQWPYIFFISKGDAARRWRPK
jgi:hypothetical protein